MLTFLDEREENELGKCQHAVAFHQAGLTEALLQLLLDNLSTVQDVYLGVLHTPNSTHYTTCTRTHARTHMHTHTHTHLYLYYHCQNWLCGPHSGGEPAGGNKTGGPVAAGTPASSPQLHGPLSAVGVLIYGLARPMR